MISLVIVEDNKDVQEILKMFLGDLDEILLIDIVGTGRSGIDLIAQRHPDVVIMDIGLPDMSGLDCIKILKPQCPKTEFMVFTVSEEDENIFEAIKLGATSYLLKSETPNEILKAVNEVHQGGSAMTSSVARKVLNYYKLQQTGGNKLEKQKKLYHISDREEEVLKLLSEGLLYKEVAERMYISVKTLKSHIYRIYGKLQVGNKTEAINRYFG